MKQSEIVKKIEEFVSKEFGSLAMIRTQPRKTKTEIGGKESVVSYSVDIEFETYMGGD